MSKFKKVTEKFGDLPFMKQKQAEFLNCFITTRKIFDVIELGFAHGKSSAYIAAILEDKERGQLTTIDLHSAVKRKPNIEDVLKKMELEHRVDVIYAHRSYTWELGKMIEQKAFSFDLCYLDAGHTWDVTGFGFVLIDLLLNPGGWIIFDDLNWTLAKHIMHNPEKEAKLSKRYSQDEINAKGVRMVWDILVPQLGYVNTYEETRFGWGIAQKPN